MDYTLHHGDCLEVMATMADNSVDAVVTDPPYGLSFMGKNWDHGVPGEAFWREALRVAKPGAHLLAFGGTRTFHRLAVAIEDAGWEIRDTVMWCYGSGFPKSLDVSKAIDRAAGAEREVVATVKKKPSASSDCNEGWVRPWAEGKTTMDITAPATSEAQQWQGWGTALKPAWEPVIMARKPLAGTVAANVLEHGTGALNVDGCRVEGAIGPTYQTGGNGKVGSGGVYEGGYRGEWSSADPHPESVRHHASGRWPANLIHDGSDEVVGLFPQQQSGGFSQGMVQHSRALNVAKGVEAERVRDARAPDAGSAARFFYCAKASKADRGEGNTHPTVKPTDLMRYLCRLVTPPGGIVLDPFMGSGSTGKAAILEGFQFIGIERDAEYLAIAEARISHASGLSQPPQRPTRQPAPACPGQLALF
jgi:site-specific DNA-methyltransferase (adenine-specific)